MDMPDTQETFDALLSVTAEVEVLFHDFHNLTEKHMEDLRTVGKTDAFYDDVQKIADKFNLKFHHPKFSGGLRTVETRPTVH